MISVLLLTAATASPPAPSTPAPSAPFRAWTLSATSTSAFGLTHAKFFNQLAGGQLDYRLTPRFTLGGGVSYANLEGKDRRVHNVLPELSSEYRIEFTRATVALPLRLAFGYLPRNGPTLRIGAGLALVLSRSLTLELTPLEPMIWVTRDRTEISLNGSARLGVSF